MVITLMLPSLKPTAIIFPSGEISIDLPREPSFKSFVFWLRGSSFPCASKLVFIILTCFLSFEDHILKVPSSETVQNASPSGKTANPQMPLGDSLLAQ